MDRLTSMAVFVKAVELGSFSAAAEVLQMSSQLVGKHVQGIEQRLGVRLLNRTTRRQSLTDFGRAFTNDPRSSWRKLRLPRIWRRKPAPCPRESCASMRR